MENLKTGTSMELMTEKIKIFKGFLLEIKSMDCRLCEIAKEIDLSGYDRYHDTMLLKSRINERVDVLRKKLCVLMEL